MKKRYLLQFVSFLVICGMLLSACATATSSPAPESSSAQAATSTPEGTQEASAPASTTSASNVAGPGQPGGGNPPDGTPPQGTPPAGGIPGQGGRRGNSPSGAPGQGGGPGGGSGDSNSSLASTASGVYVVDGTTAAQSGQTYTATQDDQSAVWVKNGGELTLTQSTLSSSGNTSSQDNSSFYGLNAVLLATSGSTVQVSDSTISSTGSGANGVFSTGSGTSVSLTNVTIQASGDGGHAVMATAGGAMTLSNVTMNTTGGSASAIATDRGGGTITVTGGKVTTSGNNSAGIYSTGVITVTGGSFQATGAEAAVIEGANSITLTDTTLSTSKDGKWGVLIYQSMSGDAEGTEGTFTMAGGELSNTAASGPLFYITNSTGIIHLKGVQLSAASGVLVNASAGNWGKEGANGGTVLLTAEDQKLNGNLTADSISSLTIDLRSGSILTGAINPDGSAKSVSLTLDQTSQWNVTADSTLTSLTDSDGISGTTIRNILGNGHTVTYDSSACPSLGGKTYDLSGGGVLKPAG